MNPHGFEGLVHTLNREAPIMFSAKVTIVCHQIIATTNAFEIYIMSPLLKLTDIDTLLVRFEATTRKSIFSNVQRQLLIVTLIGAVIQVALLMFIYFSSRSKSVLTSLQLNNSELVTSIIRESTLIIPWVALQVVSQLFGHTLFAQDLYLPILSALNLSIYLALSAFYMTYIFNPELNHFQPYLVLSKIWRNVFYVLTIVLINIFIGYLAYSSLTYVPFVFLVLTASCLEFYQGASYLASEFQIFESKQINLLFSRISLTRLYFYLVLLGTSNRVLKHYPLEMILISLPLFVRLMNMTFARYNDHCLTQIIPNFNHAKQRNSQKQFQKYLLLLLEEQRPLFVNSFLACHLRNCEDLQCPCQASNQQSKSASLIRYMIQNGKYIDTRGQILMEDNVKEMRKVLAHLGEQSLKSVRSLKETCSMMMILNQVNSISYLSYLRFDKFLKHRNIATDSILNPALLEAKLQRNAIRRRLNEQLCPQFNVDLAQVREFEELSVTVTDEISKLMVHKRQFLQILYDHYQYPQHYLLQRRFRKYWVKVKSLEDKFLKLRDLNPLSELVSDLGQVFYRELICNRKLEVYFLKRTHSNSDSSMPADQKRIYQKITDYQCALIETVYGREGLVLQSYTSKFNSIMGIDDQQSLKGSSVDLLMPYFVAAEHKAFVDKFFETGEPHQLIRGFAELYLRCPGGFIQIYDVLLRLDLHNMNDLSILAFIAQQSSEPQQVILANSKGQIRGLSHTLNTHFRMSDLEEYQPRPTDINLYQLSPIFLPDIARNLEFTGTIIVLPLDYDQLIPENEDASIITLKYSMIRFLSAAREDPTICNVFLISGEMLYRQFSNYALKGIRIYALKEINDTLQKLRLIEHQYNSYVGAVIPKEPSRPRAASDASSIRDDFVVTLVVPRTTEMHRFTSLNNRASEKLISTNPLESVQENLNSMFESATKPQEARQPTLTHSVSYDEIHGFIERKPYNFILMALGGAIATLLTSTLVGVNLYQVQYSFDGLTDESLDRMIPDVWLQSINLCLIAIDNLQMYNEHQIPKSSTIKQTLKDYVLEGYVQYHKTAMENIEDPQERQSYIAQLDVQGEFEFYLASSNDAKPAATISLTVVNYLTSFLLSALQQLAAKPAGQINISQESEQIIHLNQQITTKWCIYLEQLTEKDVITERDHIYTFIIIMILLALLVSLLLGLHLVQQFTQIVRKQHAFMSTYFLFSRHDLAEYRQTQMLDPILSPRLSREDLQLQQTETMKARKHANVTKNKHARRWFICRYSVMIIAVSLVGLLYFLPFYAYVSSVFAIRLDMNDLIFQLGLANLQLSSLISQLNQRITHTSPQNTPNRAQLYKNAMQYIAMRLPYEEKLMRLRDDEIDLVVLFTTENICDALKDEEFEEYSEQLYVDGYSLPKPILNYHTCTHLYGGALTKGYKYYNTKVLDDLIYFESFIFEGGVFNLDRAIYLMSGNRYQELIISHLYVARYFSFLKSMIANEIEHQTKRTIRIFFIVSLVSAFLILLIQGTLMVRLTKDLRDNYGSAQTILLAFGQQLICSNKQILMMLHGKQ